MGNIPGIAMGVALELSKHVTGDIEFYRKTLCPRYVLRCNILGTDKVIEPKLSEHN